MSQLDEDVEEVRDKSPEKVGWDTDFMVSPDPVKPQTKLSAGKKSQAKQDEEEILEVRQPQPEVIGMTQI